MTVPKRSKQILLVVSVLLTLAAVADQLRQPRGERTWQGKIIGLPYDMRPPSPRRIAANWWKPEDDRLLVPRAFGVGWDVNLHQLYVLLKRSRTTGTGQDQSRA